MSWIRRDPRIKLYRGLLGTFQQLHEGTAIEYEEPGDTKSLIVGPGRVQNALEFTIRKRFAYLRGVNNLFDLRFVGHGNLTLLSRKLTYSDC